MKVSLVNSSGYLDPDIPILAGLTQDEVELLTISVGAHQRVRPLQPIEISGLMEKSINAGTSLGVLSESIGLSKSMIGSFRSLTKLTQQVQRVISWNRSRTNLTLETATFLARLHKKDQWKITELALTAGLTGAELRSAFQISKRAQIDLEIAIEKVISRRPKIVQRHVFVGSVTNTKLITNLSNLRQNERDFVLKTACKDLFGNELISTVLGNNQFILVLSELTEQFTSAKTEQTVKTINKQIQETLKNIEL